MYNTLNDYNHRNYTPLFNVKIQEEICNVMEEESIMDANNVTLDTFSHVSNEQSENANAIFISEKQDKLDELVDAVKNLKINDAKYYESNTASSSDTQGDIKRNP